MIKILNREISDNKYLLFALTKIFGIGRSLSKKILITLKIYLKSKLSDLSTIQLNILRKYLLNLSYKLEDNLKRKIYFSIKNLQEIRCYRGIRLLKGLPARGQRTKTNASTSNRLVGFQKNLFTE